MAGIGKCLRPKPLRRSVVLNASVRRMPKRVSSGPSLKLIRGMCEQRTTKTVRRQLHFRFVLPHRKAHRNPLDGRACQSHIKRSKTTSLFRCNLAVTVAPYQVPKAAAKRASYSRYSNNFWRVVFCPNFASISFGSKTLSGNSSVNHFNFVKTFVRVRDVEGP